MVLKLVPTKKKSYIYIVVKSSNQKINGQIFQSDEIISIHKTRQGAEQKIIDLSPNTPTRSFTRYQIRKFLLNK